MYKELNSFKKPESRYTESFRGYYGFSNHIQYDGYGCIVEQSEAFLYRKSHFLTIFKNGYKVYNEEDVCEYLHFLNNCGYPIVLENSSDCYTFVFNTSEYNNWSYFLAAFTSLRYIFHYWQPDNYLIPKEAIRLKNLFDDSIDEMEALQLAHYTAFNLKSLYVTQPDRLHSLFGEVSLLQSKESCINRLLSGSYTVNESFEQHIISKTKFKTMAELANTDINKALKILKPDVKEILPKSSE